MSCTISETKKQALRRRVLRGAELLDEQHAGWALKIDTAKLDLGCCYQCILGQLYGVFSDGLVALNLEDDDADADYTDLGLDGEKVEMYPILDELWKEQIQQRLKKGEVSCDGS